MYEFWNKNLKNNIFSFFSFVLDLKMIRLGGPEGDSEEERRISNVATVGNFVIFALSVFSINLAPYLLEQFGLDVVK